MTPGPGGPDPAQARAGTVTRPGGRGTPGPGTRWGARCRAASRARSGCRRICPCPRRRRWRWPSDLLDSGRPFHAHEVLEASWKQAPEPERELWRGLAQVAVGLTHAQRGNARGAVALLRRGAERVSGYAAAPPHGIDAAGIARAAAGLAARIEAAGDTAAAAAQPRISLTRS